MSSVKLLLEGMNAGWYFETLIKSFHGANSRRFGVFRKFATWLSSRVITGGIIGTAQHELGSNPRMRTFA